MCKYSSVQEGDCDSRRGAQKLGISVEELKKHGRGRLPPERG